MDVEPYVHKTIGEVEGLNIDQQIKSRKKYFQEWLKSISITEFNDKTPEQLTAALDKFIEDKLTIKTVTLPEVTAAELNNN